jgi:hypothetical protein
MIKIESLMQKKPFKDGLFDAFLEWEQTQPKKRSSFSAFARWLSNNSSNIIIRQQNVDSWINGSIPKDFKYVSVLVEKLGDWVLESLDIPVPNPYLQKINKLFERLPPEKQRKLAEDAERYDVNSQKKK